MYFFMRMAISFFTYSLYTKYEKRGSIVLIKGFKKVKKYNKVD